MLYSTTVATIVNDMGSHTVHTTHVPERCSIWPDDDCL